VRNEPSSLKGDTEKKKAKGTCELGRRGMALFARRCFRAGALWATPRRAEARRMAPFWRPCSTKPMLTKTKWRSAQSAANRSPFVC
jgi:hypothetical protein